MELFLRKCNKEKDTLNFYKKNIIFEKAPEPEDILFENLEFDSKPNAKHAICLYFIFLIIFNLSLFINSLLYEYQKSIDEYKDKNDKTTITYALSFLITIISSIIDLIFEIALEKLIKWQKIFINL